MIAVAGDEGALAIRREGDVARARLGVADLNLASWRQGFAIDGEDRHRAISAICHQY